MSCACEQDFLGKNLSNAGEWVAAFYLVLTSGNSLTQSSDQWLDCRAWQDLFLLIEFQGASGSTLTVKLQTAVAPSADAAAWSDVTGASTTMTTATAVIEAPHSLAMPILGVVRLVYSVTGATATGTVRVQVLRKLPA